MQSWVTKCDFVVDDAYVDNLAGMVHVVENVLHRMLVACRVDRNRRQVTVANGAKLIHFTAIAFELHRMFHAHLLAAKLETLSIHIHDDEFHLSQSSKLND